MRCDMQYISLTPREAVHDQLHPQQRNLLEVVYSLTLGKTGTDRRSNRSLSEVVTLDSAGGFGGPHNTESGVPSSDVALILDLIPVRMVFTEAVRPSLFDIEILQLQCLFNDNSPSNECDLRTLLNRQHHASLVACMPQVPLFLNNVQYRQ